MNAWKVKGAGAYADTVLKVAPVVATEFDEGGVIFGASRTVGDGAAVSEFMATPEETVRIIGFARWSSIGARITICDEMNEGVEVSREEGGLKVKVFSRNGICVSLVGNSAANALAMGLESVMGKVMFGE